MVGIVDLAKLYLWDRYRSSSPKDYLSMGLGIEARRNRNKERWHKHLEYSQDFQRDQLAEQRGFSVAILGAGRLYDVPCDFYAQRCEKVVLYDWDIGASKSWKEWRRRSEIKMEMNCCDILGTLERWSQIFSRKPGDADNVARTLLGLKVDYTVLPSVTEDVVVSLNLLSQLSVYWWDRVEKWLGESLISNRLITEALGTSCKELEQAHLYQLSNSGAERIIVLADRYLHYYRSSLAKWQTDTALFADFPESLPGYERVASDSWFWHIAPQGVEQPDYGEIREVGAVAFRRLK